MQEFLRIITTGSTVLVLASILLYAPFAKTWTRALAVPALLYLFASLIDGIYYILFASNEVDPPGIAALAFLVCVLFAAVARSIKLALFTVPVLKRLEERIRGRFRDLKAQQRSGSKTQDHS